VLASPGPTPAPDRLADVLAEELGRPVTMDLQVVSTWTRQVSSGTPDT
jgi:hypothetical protein